eukprot:768431-Hanusia_phi.AAC.4
MGSARENSVRSERITEETQKDKADDAYCYGDHVIRRREQEKTSKEGTAGAKEEEAGDRFSPLSGLSSLTTTLLTWSCT